MVQMLAPTSRILTSTKISILCRLILGFMFLLSSLPKLRNSQLFLESVYGFQLVGPKAGILIAIVIPWLELLIAVALLTGIYVRGSLFVALILSLMFVTANISAVVRGLHISCGCFGDDPLTPITWFTVAISAVVGLTAASGLISSFLDTKGTVQRGV